MRVFLRDKLNLKATDVGDGWLVLDVPSAEVGIHPTSGRQEMSGFSEISFYCENISLTVAELEAKGVMFTQKVEDRGYGLVTYFKVPGQFLVQLFEPKYKKSIQSSFVNGSSPPGAA